MVCAWTSVLRIDLAFTFAFVVAECVIVANIAQSEIPGSDICRKSEIISI